MVVADGGRVLYRIRSVLGDFPGVVPLTLAVASFLMVVNMVVLSPADRAEIHATAQLGASEGSIRVIAGGVPDGDVDYGPVGSLLEDFATRHGLSLAYAPTSDGGLVTVFDPQHRFRDATGSLQIPSGEDDPVLLLSESVASTAELSPLGLVEPSGTFDPDLRFDGEKVLGLVNSAAQRYGTGTYFVVGDIAATPGLHDDLTSILGSNELEVLATSDLPKPTLGDTLRDYAASPLGIAYMLFSVAGMVAVIIALAGVARQRLRRYAVAALIGAPRSQIRGSIMIDLLRWASPGLLLGAAMASVLVLVTHRLALSSLWEFLFLCMAVSLSVVGIVAIASAGIAAALTLRLQHAVPL